MKKILALLAFASLFTACKEDVVIDDEPPTPCETNRYLTEQFDQLDSTTIQYGSNVLPTGTSRDLYMDIYSPANDDLAARPVLIWAFGGAFIGGQRSDMRQLAIASAKRGYVSATIDYRLLSLLGGIPNSTEALDIAVKAMGDMKAAVKYFKYDAATQNQFKIDPNQIYVGGVSAGAITALHTAMVTQEDLVDQEVIDVVEQNGGVEGSSALPEAASYDSKVKGVINLSGAVYDLEFIDAGDPSVISFHGDADMVVPYGSGFANVFGIDILRLNGSKVITERCNEVGVDASLTTVPNGDHNLIYSEDEFAGLREGFTTDSFEFFKKIICK